MRQAENVEARVKPLDEHVMASDQKCSKTIEKLAQVGTELCTRVTSIAAELKVVERRMALFEEDSMDEHTKD